MHQLFGEARLGKARRPQPSVARSSMKWPSRLIAIPYAFRGLARPKNAGRVHLHALSVTVCALMVSLGREARHGRRSVPQAGFAGMLHDPGKALMPQDVLNKPGKLTPEEFEIIKQHPVKEYELLIRPHAYTKCCLMISGLPASLPGHLPEHILRHRLPPEQRPSTSDFFILPRKPAAHRRTQSPSRNNTVRVHRVQHQRPLH